MIHSKAVTEPLHLFEKLPSNRHSVAKANYRSARLTTIQKEFLESRYQQNPGRWDTHLTGKYAKILGVANKKITEWKWHR